MSPSEIADLLAVVEKRWPHAPLPLGSADVWLEDLRDVPAEAAHDAVSAWGRNGERFPPTSGWVRSEALRDEQAMVPGFGDVAISKWLPTRVLLYSGLYSPEGSYTEDATAQAVAIMAVNGAHEAVLRFVVERGLRAVLTMPHGDMHGLDPNQAADHRDMARHYRDVTVPGWQRDPRRGVALERACRAAGEDPAALVSASRELVERWRPAPPRRELEAGEADDGPMVPVENVLEVWRADRAEAARRRAEVVSADRSAEDEAQRAALAELEAHKAKRKAGAS